MKALKPGASEHAVALSFLVRLPWLVLASAAVLFAWPLSTLFLYLVYFPYYWFSELSGTPDMSSNIAIATNRVAAVLFCVLGFNWLLLIGAVCRSEAEIVFFIPLVDHPKLEQRVFWVLTSAVPAVLFLTLIVLRTLPQPREVE